MNRESVQHFLQLIRRERGLAGIIFVFVLLTLGWNLSVPAHEAPDEPAHIQYAYYLVQHSGLPDLRYDLREAGLEAVQPPLYYWLVGGMFRLMGLPSIDLNPPRNPSFQFLSAKGGMNRFVLPQPQWAIHLVRLVSLVLGVVTVALTFALALQITAQRETALLAASLTAFLPQFTFMAGVVSNDNLSTALGAVTMVCLVRISQQPPAQFRDWFGIGLVVGTALLAKSSLLILLPLVALALVNCANRNLHRLLITGLICGAGIFVVSGWYYARNLYVYDDLIAVSRWEIQASDQVPFRAPGWSYFWNPFPQLLFRSYFGVFGWLNIFLPEPIYLSFLVSVIISLVGLWWMAWRRLFRPARIWLILLLFPGLVFVLVGVWNITYIAPQGRLLFSALATISTLLAIGIGAYPARVRRVLVLGIASLYLAINLFSIGWVFVGYRAGG